MSGAEPEAEEPKRQWQDRTWISRDGLKLYYRDYPGQADRPPLVMLHGLTRNSRDFEDLAARYAGDWRVIVPDFRGRGRSQYDPDPANYQPRTYAADILQLLDELGIAEAVFMGTSLGGLVTMIIATMEPQRIAGALINDIGPEIDPAGIDRIKSYVGKSNLFDDWAEAAAELRRRHAEVHPAYGDAEWLRHARRVGRKTDRGVEFDYDMRIAEPFQAGETGAIADGWRFYRALAGRPVLVLRGEYSDLLAADVFNRMAGEIADVEVVTVPGVGHAPDLGEPEAVAGIDRLLERVLRR